METNIYLVEGPTQQPVSLEDMKAHLRVDSSDEDDLIQGYMDAVVAHIDGGNGKLGRALVSQTWDLKLDYFDPCGRIELPLAPLLEVVSVQYYDTADALQTLSTDDYLVIGIGGHPPGYVAQKLNAIWPNTYCKPEAVIVRFRAGYIDTSASPPVGEIPAPILHAIKTMTASLYDNRETIIVGQTPIEIEMAAKVLLGRYQVYS